MRARWSLSMVLTALFAAAASAATNDAAWLEDIDFFAATLPAVHVNAFTQLSRESFDAEIQQLRTDVPSLADHEVIARLMRIAASIGDSHTTIYRPPFTRFPITLYWLSDGFYVVRADEGQSDLIAARVVSIDARPIDEIVGEVAALIPHENVSWLRELAPDALTTPELLHSTHVIPTPLAASFRFAAVDGSTIDRTLNAVKESSIRWTTPSSIRYPLYQRDTSTNYWYDYQSSNGTLYVQYNRCANMPARPMTQFGKELATLAGSRPVARLVLDLRHNGGGDSSLIERMLGELYASNPHLDDPSRFFVVIGPSTFSSGMMNAFQIGVVTNATLIGLPTGGKPNHFGNVRTFTLPRSGLTVQYSTQRFDLVSDGDPSSLMPDVPIDLTASDYFAGRDPVMLHIAPVPPRRRAVRK